MQKFLLLLALPLSGLAFLTPALPRNSDVMMMKASTTTSSSSSSSISRQEQLGGAFRAFTLVGLGGAILLNGGMVAPANAAKAEYLPEPTPEFKALQEKTMAFEKAAYEQKKIWLGRFKELEAAKTEAELVKGLDGLTAFVLEYRGLPVGVKKQQVVSDIRKLKRAGKENKTWTKEVEISYEQLTYSINYQQSPNTQRDLANPL